MTRSDTMAETANGLTACDPVMVPMSDWLCAAIPEATRREPLLAAEDAIMLLDIFIALSRATLTLPRVMSNPMIGGWLKRAITDNLARPLDDVLRDTEFLRDLLVMTLFRNYRKGHLSDTDHEMRLINIINMISGVGTSVVAQWSCHTAAHLQRLAESADGGLSEFQDCAAADSAGGHREIAEIFERLCDLSEAELKDQLHAMSHTLLAAKTQIQ